MKPKYRVTAYTNPSTGYHYWLDPKHANRLSEIDYKSIAATLYRFSPSHYSQALGIVIILKYNKAAGEYLPFRMRLIKLKRHI